MAAAGEVVRVAEVGLGAGRWVRPRATRLTRLTGGPPGGSWGGQEHLGRRRRSRRRLARGRRRASADIQIIR